MNRVDLVRAAWNLDNPQADYGAYYTDDFEWSDSVGGPPMNKSTWLGMSVIMRAAFPDLSYIIEDIREEGDKVSVTGHFSGTFTNDFDLSAMGMGSIPASGKRVDFPNSTALVSVADDKISKVVDLTTGPDAGMGGFLKALSGDTGK